MGNSLLQSGSSVGAILTPILVEFLTTRDVGGWRPPFIVIGAAGTAWTFLWLATIRKGDLAPLPPEQFLGAENSSLRDVIFSPRFAAMAVMVVFISICWQLFRVWLPQFLQEGRGYVGSEVNYFTSCYYVATDVGVISAGVAALRLPKWGLSIHASRSGVYFFCSSLTLLTIAAALLPKGDTLLIVLLFIGFGALGVFPCYYSFTQELSVRYMGIISGLLGTVAWVIPGWVHEFFGQMVDETKSYDLGIALSGCFPMIAFLCFWILWDRGRKDEPPSSIPAAAS